LGTLNWSDHLPWLADFDPQKIRFRCSNLVPKVNRFVSRILAEHRAQAGNETPDFVDVLLSLQGHDKLSDSDMIAVLWVSKQTHEYMYITRESYYTIFCPNM
jgi:cytochrome P450